jgi:hypothetical protein
MTIAFLNRARGSGSTRAFDADVLAWRDAVVANGSSVSLARLVIVDQFVFSEKESGCWALTDDYLGFWAENAAQALTSLKQRRLAAAINSPIFTADRHYAFDGSTSYIDTGFIANTHASSMTASSVHIELYERTDVNGTANATALGVTSGSSRSMRVITRNNSTALGYANGGSATFTLPSNTSLGLTQLGRLSATAADVYGYKNGVSMPRTVDPGAVGAPLPSHSLFVGGLNNQGVYNSGRTASVGFAAWGAALASGQCLARYNAVQAWATSVGANV